nr:uncharacterized protein LOC108011402 [Drosophila suzukii]
MAMKRGNQLMRPSLFVLLSAAWRQVVRVRESERSTATLTEAATEAEAKKDFRACGLRSVCNGIPRATVARITERDTPVHPYTPFKNRILHKGNMRSAISNSEMNKLRENKINLH